MPAKAEWLLRLPEILAALRALDIPVVDRAAIEHPAEMQFSFAVVNLAPIPVRGKLSIPSADKTIEGFSLVSERRMGSARREHIAHCLWRGRAAGSLVSGSLSNGNCANSQDEHEACDSDLECVRFHGITHAAMTIEISSTERSGIVRDAFDCLAGTPFHVVILFENPGVPAIV